MVTFREQLFRADEPAVEQDANSANRTQQKPRVISNPDDVAHLVLMQIDAVNSKKDELTLALKGLTDLSKQLVRVYGENTKTIVALKKKIAEFKE